MFGKRVRITSLVLMALCLAFAAPQATADEALDKAFDTLKTYDWGSDRAALKPIDDAVAASAKEAGARKELEGLLASTVTSDVSQAAKDFCCRKLSLVGSAGCVASVAPLLTDEKLSHGPLCPGANPGRCGPGVVAQRTAHGQRPVEDRGD